MIREYVDGWLAPSEEIVYHMDSNIRTQLSEIVHEIFQKYIPGGLHALVGCVHRPLLCVSDSSGDRSIIEECMDQLKDICLQRIGEAFDREKSITATLQTRRFEAYRDIYEEHYTAMYQRHVMHDDMLSKLGNALEGILEEKINELLPKPLQTALLGPDHQDVMGMLRMKNHPGEGLNKVALQIMAEVRSYYDCK
jgi:hypothetical protein